MRRCVRVDFLAAQRAETLLAYLAIQKLGAVAALADAWETAEAREGVSAFLEKRRPAWALV